MAESKYDKFIRIAEARTNKIIDMMKLLSNCANKSTYDYDDEDVKKIFSTLEQELKKCKSKFQDVENKNNKFSLR